MSRRQPQYEIAPSVGACDDMAFVPIAPRPERRGIKVSPRVEVLVELEIRRVFGWPIPEGMEEYARSGRR